MPTQACARTRCGTSFLHYPAVLSPFDNLHVGPLQANGLVSDQVDGKSHAAAREAVSQRPEAVKEVEGFVVADVEHALPGTVPPDPLAEFLRFQAYRRKHSGLEDPNLLYCLFDTYDDEYLVGPAENFGDTALDLPGRRGSPISGRDLVAMLTAGSSREEFEAFKAFQRNELFYDAFAASIGGLRRHMRPRPITQ